ncbi:MAG: RNA methyltransferase substrate-binding domain-containing protein, partial [Alphaproteobacteria bacterium]
MAQKQHKKNKGLWIYGTHPVEMALQNRRRHIHEIWCAKGVSDSLKIPRDISLKTVTRDQLDSLLGAGTLHQG